MQKRLISMVLALSMALTAMPLPALAQSAPPDTASAAALAEENDVITNLYTDDWSGKPVGDLGDSGDSWSYDEASNTLTLKTGTFRLRNYSGYNNYIRWNIQIGKDATLLDARIGSDYDGWYTVTNAGTISGGTFYGKVTCAAGSVIKDGNFKNAVTVDAAGGNVTIDGGSFEKKVTVNAVDTLTIYGGTFTDKVDRSMDISDATAKVVINGGSFEKAIMDLSAAAAITINSGLFKDPLYGAAQNCTVNGGLFTAASDPLPAEVTVKGGYFVAERAGLVKIDASKDPVYPPAAVAENGIVNKWSADAYETLYVVSGTQVTLRPTYKLNSVVSGDKKLNYIDRDDAVKFTVGTEAVQLDTIIWENLVIEASGYPKGTSSGHYGAKGEGWSFDPAHKREETFSDTVPTLIIEAGTTLNFDEVKNNAGNAGTVKFAVENHGTFSGALNSAEYVYNKEGGTIRNATLNSPQQSLYNNGLVEDSVLRFRYIGNGWRETAQPATIRNSALDITGWSLANSSTYKAVLDGCYNSAGYTGTAVIQNGGTVKNSKSTLKLVVENTAGYDGNAKFSQPIIDGGEYTTVYNEGGIIQNNPTIHALVAKVTEDLNGASGYYTLNYTAPEDAEYSEKYINGINGMTEGIWSAAVSTLYVATDWNTISVTTQAPIKSVNGVAYNGSSVADGERYNSTIDLRKYNIPQTRVLNLSATDEGVAALPSADPADFTFVLPTDPTYDGNPKWVEVIVNDNIDKKYGAVTVTYKKDGAALNGAPIEPGTYTFTVNVAATATCAGGDVTPKDNKFTIQKAAMNPADFTVTEPTDLTYDGNPKEVTVKNNSDKDYGKITVIYEMSGGKVVQGAPVEPGKYFYSVVTAGSALYKSGSVADGTFTITNAVKPDPKPELDPADFTFTLPADLTYDGTAKMVTVKNNSDKTYGTVTVTYKQNGEVLDGVPIEPGTYTFTAVVAPTATCAGGDVTPKDNKFTIQKAALNPADFTVTGPTDLTYDGTPKEVTVKNTSDKDYGEITVTYKQNGEALNGAPTEPGEYSYTVTAAGSARYVGGTVKTGSFSITNAGTIDPEPEKTYRLTVAGADITLPEDADASALKAGQLVSLTAYPDTATERFSQWVVSGADGALSPADLMDAADEPLTEDAFKQRTLTFRMPAQNLNITAMTTPVEQPPQEDSTEYSTLQTVAILAGTTAWFAGGTVLAYEAVTCSILADLLPEGTAIPTTREQLAVLLWSTAGKPEPAAPAVYSDVTEPDAAKAARWAVEAGLLPDKGEGVFTPGKRVTKVQVIRAWNQLKKLGLAK